MNVPGFHGAEPVTTIKHAVKDFAEDDMMTYAAALAFRILLALFPFVLFLLALLGVLGLGGFFDRLLNQAQAALPGDAYGLLAQSIGEIRSQPRGGLVSVSIVFAIWAASAGVRSLMNALNIAYDVEESRPVWKLYPLSIVYTIGLAILILIAAGLTLVGPRVLDWLGGAGGMGVVTALWTWLRWPLAVLLVMITVAVVYYVAPNIKQPFAIVTPGSVLAVLGWIVASIGFSFYVSRFANYSATYGSLGGVIVLLLYFFITAAVLLFGAELNAAIYHVRYGPPRPKG